MNKRECLRGLDLCSSHALSIIYPSWLIEPWLFTGFISFLKMSASSALAPFFHIYCYPTLHYVLHSRRWGQWVVTFSLTTSTGCTSGCDKQTALPQSGCHLSLQAAAQSSSRDKTKTIKSRLISLGFFSACVYISFLEKWLDETKYANKYNRCCLPWESDVCSRVESSPQTGSELDCTGQEAKTSIIMKLTETPHHILQH